MSPLKNPRGAGMDICGGADAAHISTYTAPPLAVELFSAGSIIEKLGRGLVNTETTAQRTGMGGNPVCTPVLNGPWSCRVKGTPYRELIRVIK